MDLGNQLEKQGWLQASIVNKTEAQKLLQCTDTQAIDIDVEALLNDDFVFVVSSQSCDIARNDVATVQLLLARIIDKRDPQKSYNSNPRHLDTFYSEIIESVDTGEAEIVEHSLRVSLQEKVFVKKYDLINSYYLSSTHWGDQEERSFRSWLGEQFTRPALPTAFNNLLKNAGKVESKLRKQAKNLNDDLYAIYVRLNPNAEIVGDEYYEIQILGALANDGDITNAQSRLDRYKELIESAGITVTHCVVRNKNQISMAMLEGMTRFHLDFLSYREIDAEIPLDVNPGL